jgi:hypothetical protein
MPIIAIFDGIIIQMFFEDHDPLHVHVIYSGAKALVRIAMAKSSAACTSPTPGEKGKRLGEAEAARLYGELAACANRRPLFPDRWTR